MIWFFLFGFFLAAWIFFFLGTAYGVKREYERWHESQIRLERLRRNGLIDGY